MCVIRAVVAFRYKAMMISKADGKHRRWSGAPLDRIKFPSRRSHWGWSMPNIMTSHKTIMVKWNSTSLTKSRYLRAQVSLGLYQSRPTTSLFIGYSEISAKSYSWPMDRSVGMYAIVIVFILFFIIIFYDISNSPSLLRFILSTDDTNVCKIANGMKIFYGPSSKLHQTLPDNKQN